MSCNVLASQKPLSNWLSVQTCVVLINFSLHNSRTYSVNNSIVKQLYLLSALQQILCVTNRLCNVLLRQLIRVQMVNLLYLSI